MLPAQQNSFAWRTVTFLNLKRRKTGIVCFAVWMFMCHFGNPILRSLCPRTDVSPRVRLLFIRFSWHYPTSPCRWWSKKLKPSTVFCMKSAWGDTIGSTMTAGHRFFSLCLGHVTQVWWMYAGLVFERNNFNQECCSSSCAFKSVICSHNTPDHSTHFLFFRCIIVAILFQHRILRHRSTASRLLQRMKSEMGCEAGHWKVSRLSLMRPS